MPIAPTACIAWSHGGEATFTMFTLYKDGVLCWLEDTGDVLQNPVLADNGSGAVVFCGTTS